MKIHYLRRLVVERDSIAKPIAWLKFLCRRKVTIHTHIACVEQIHSIVEMRAIDTELLSSGRYRRRSHRRKGATKVGKLKPVYSFAIALAREMFRFDRNAAVSLDKPIDFITLGKCRI